MNLSSTIKSIQDIMRKDDGVDGDAQRLGQLTWMLFLKVFDQREEEWEDDAKENGKTYTSSIPEQYRWRNWAGYEIDTEGKRKPQKQGSELIPFVTEMFDALKQIDANKSKQHNNAPRPEVLTARRSTAPSQWYTATMSGRWAG